MHPAPRSPRVAAVARLAALVTLAALTPLASAAQYVVTVQSSYLDDYSYTETFDGTNYGTLPFYPLDNARLIGGTMREHFIINDVTTVVGGTNAFYEFEPSAEWTYDLFDPQGNLVHHGSRSSGGFGYVQNNLGGAPFTTDQVFITGDFADVSGLTAASSAYALFLNVADISCFGYISPGVDYLTDLSLPLDPAVYFSFPPGQTATDVNVAVGSGDIVNFTAPYAFSSSSLAYSINSLTITPIPEPAALTFAAPAALALARRRRA